MYLVGKIRLPEYLQQQLKNKKGDIIEISKDFIHQLEEPNRVSLANIEHALHLDETDLNSSLLQDLFNLSEPVHYVKNNGVKVGEHEGAHYFTVGQRKGLQVGGKAEPLFVLETNTTNNILYTGQGDDHKGLYRNCLRMLSNDISWVRKETDLKPNEILRLKARVRYRQPLQDAYLIHRGLYHYLWFDKPQRGITSGQFAACYKDDELLGSGAIV